MVGAPGESDKTVKESLEMMRALKVPAYINITTPYKGTSLFDYYLKKGIIREEDLQGGTSIDIRLPVEKAENYHQILKWRRKLQICNILYAWKDIISSDSFFNLNAISRFFSGILFSRKITSSLCDEIMNRYLRRSLDAK
jgi:hypothetical protein